MRLKPGTLVVLEGLDKTGKSTQMERLLPLFIDDHFIHSPSGDGSPIGTMVYEYTESTATIHPAARQLLHLAAAADFYDRKVVPWLGREGVFMDRCWWSTIAYGYYGGLKHLMGFDAYLEMCLLPTQGVMPAVVFVFMHTQRYDKNNTEALVDAYWEICKLYPEVVEPIEIGTPEEVTEQIVDALMARKLARID